MSNDYNLYHWDNENRCTDKAIMQNVAIHKAHQKAVALSKVAAGVSNSDWQRIPAGENCKFLIEGRPMGFIIIKQNAGPDYDYALNQRLKKTA